MAQQRERQPGAPALAFIVPAFNAAHTLGDTLRSLQAQTRSDWIAVVVDDGGSDDPASVVGSFADPRISIYRQENRGLAGARNAGLARCDSEAVCFLDADDVVRPRFADEMLSALAGHDLAACAFEMVGPQLENLDWTVRPGSQDTTLESLSSANAFAVGAMVVRRDVFDRLRLPPPWFDETLRVLEDWDLWLRLTKAGARWAPVVADPLFCYRVRPSSLSAGLENMWTTGLLLLRRHGGSELLEMRERRWTLSVLARAAGRPDPVMVRRLIDFLGGLREADEGALVGALRTAFRREEPLPAGVTAARQDAWRARARELFENYPHVDRLVSRLSWSADRWRRIAAGALNELKPGESLVVYGLGLNGRALLETPEFQGTSVEVIDDNPEARTDKRRISLADLDESRVVLVTPEDRAGILRKLAETGARRVLFPEQFDA